MTESKKSNKLAFKGEKKAKKHKKRKHADLDGIDDDGPTVVGGGSGGAAEGWCNPPFQSHILGPLYLICISPSASAYTSSSSPDTPTPTPCAVAIFPTPISPIAKVAPAALSETALETLEPDDVNHVLVCARVLDSEDKVTLRVANGRYLGSDEVGQVEAEREARGVQEEWAFEPVGAAGCEGEVEGEDKKGKGKAVATTTNINAAPATDGIYALRSYAYQKYLSVEEVAGGKLELRCDSESPTDKACHFLVRMQAEQLVVAKKRIADERAKKGVGRGMEESGLVVLKPGETFGDLEASGIRNAQTRGAGRLITSTESKTALKKARKDGRLAEELLDRRAKLKSDRYAR